MTKEDLDKMIDWEDGILGKAETIALFQKLVDSGDAWVLQGCYGRQAQKMINAGLIKLKKGKR